MLFNSLLTIIILLCLLDSTSSIKNNGTKRDPNIKRPEKGNGTILISYDDVIVHKNKNRILVVFNRVCVQDIGDSDDRLLAKIDHIRGKYIECIDLFHKLSRKHYDTGNYSYVWMDLHCPLEVIQGKKNITIDYDELCIEYIMYEPLIYPEQTDINNTNNTNATYECKDIETEISTTWNLDELDSPWLDGTFSYVDIETIASNSDGLDIFIIDSGIQGNHSEFGAEQVIHVIGDGAASITINSNTMYDTHGTHVAGSLSGLNYGSSRGFTIYDYRVCEYKQTEEGLELPCYGSLIMDALRRVIDTLENNGGRRGVINLSLGGERSSATDDLYHSYFDSITDVGGIVVVAAGNEQSDACNFTPAYSSNAITVGAFDINRKESWFSNYGNCVTVWGPGSDIYSAKVSDSGDEYTYLSGTSMASPMIAGIVANILVVEPTLSFDGVISALKENATFVTGGECDEYECLSPVYACGQRVYGDAIPWQQPDDGLSNLQILLISLGCLLIIIVIIMVIAYCTKNQREIPHERILDDENANVMIHKNEQQQIMVDETQPFRMDI